MWRDGNREWELAIGEFSGKPFKPEEDKIFYDRCKLFRGMKDILDDRLQEIAQIGLTPKAYEIAQKMLVYGLQSCGNIITIFALNMPFRHVYVVSSICSLEVPCQGDMDEKIKIQNLIDRFWNILRVIIIAR